ncbi:MAG: ribulose-phosphate 3-epimerase [Christensenellaceae bacterium]|jgi:ribulose-phosphate 3-epimerase|nr:ribulose-phosphate 3-epimerase [Christensenellaceae bacterium]
MIKIAPSVLSADFANMGQAVQALVGWGADYVHFDVMDGSFVPAITFGPAMCKAVRPYTKLPVDVHLMVEHPDTQVEAFAVAGADIITFHVEADCHAHRTLQHIHALGRKAGVVLCPATPVCMVENLLDSCDMILLMSVNPGAGGQSFIPGTLDKIRALREMAQARGIALDIEVDGGINPETAKPCIQVGANVLVAGNSVFTAPNPKDVIAQMRGTIV